MDIPIEFIRFSSLPLEIRQAIYILATPPRIVHIRERTEDRELFEERLRTTSKSKIPHSNSGLEPDGSSDSGASNRPWEPSTATPEIPLEWVVENPEVAWELTRDSYLCSKAPIPALLHTCAESRMTLINNGYQLAFRTRSNGPRTWFHFDRDVLFIGKNVWKLTDIGFKNEIHLLGKSPWSIGRFHPKDLKRVRKLALGGAAYFIEHTGSRSHSYRRAINELADTIRLFSGVSVLFLEGWAQDHIGHWTNPFSTFKLPCTQTTSTDRLQELWCCVAVEEVDSLFGFSADKTEEKLCLTSKAMTHLRAHKRENDCEVPFFQHLQLQIEKKLNEHREEIIRSSNDPSITRWEIPNIKLAYVLKSQRANFLFDKRQRIWKDFSEMKYKAEQTTPNEFFQCESEQGLMCNEFCLSCENRRALIHRGYENKRWWIESGTLPAPRNEIYLLNS